MNRVLMGLAVMFVLAGCSAPGSLPPPQTSSGSEPHGLEVNSFGECVSAGYPVVGSYPRQCQDPAGNVFVEEMDGSTASPSDDMGSGDEMGYPDAAGGSYTIGDRVSYMGVEGIITAGGFEEGEAMMYTTIKDEMGNKLLEHQKLYFSDHGNLEIIRYKQRQGEPYSVIMIREGMGLPVCLKEAGDAKFKDYVEAAFGTGAGLPLLCD